MHTVKIKQMKQKGEMVRGSADCIVMCDAMVQSRVWRTSMNTGKVCLCSILSETKRLILGLLGAMRPPYDSHSPPHCSQTVSCSQTALTSTFPTTILTASYSISICQFLLRWIQSDEGTSCHV